MMNCNEIQSESEGSLASSDSSNEVEFNSVINNVTTRRLRISLMTSIGLMKQNHGVDYGPVPAHAWSFSNSAQHHWRSIISCDCRTSMEQSSYQRHCINFSTIFQETT